MVDARGLATVSFVACTVLAFATSRASAAELEVSLSSSISYGEYVVLSLQLTDPVAGSGEPRLAPVDGLRITGPRGPEVGSYTQIANGRRTTTRILKYAFFLEPEPGRTGTFEIGPVRIAQPGASDLVSRVHRLAVWRKPPPGVIVECEATPPGGPIGAPFRVVYTVLYPHESRSRSNDLGNIFGSRNDGQPRLRALEFPILSDDALRVKSIALGDGSAQDTVDLGERKIIRESSFAVRDNGLAYASHRFAFEVVPRRKGRFEVGRAQAAMLLPTGGTVRSRDVFGRVFEEPASKDFRGEAASRTIEVYDLPLEGQPPGFTGAVGRYSIEVRANERKVRAFDPIELEVIVRGEGLLEDLAAPDWTKIPELTADFRVSSSCRPCARSGATSARSRRCRFRSTTRGSARTTPRTRSPSRSP